mmetsp:Transcript_76703/g.94160  ORF Transcript_76703/g.94160 Transcript_76703/m.94160 type:complete len:904 (+) Transcript_76703:57-2768(+)
MSLEEHSDDSKSPFKDKSDNNDYKSTEIDEKINIKSNDDTITSSDIISQRRTSRIHRYTTVRRNEGGLIPKIPKEGYCMVFKRLTKFFEVKVVNNEVLRLEKNPELQLTDQEWDEQKPDLDFERINNFLMNFKEANIKYTIRYSSDSMKEYIFVIITTKRDIAKEFAQRQQIDLRINPPEAIIAGRSIDEFLLAHRTFVPEIYDGIPTNYDDDPTFMYQNEEYPKLDIKNWNNIHIGYTNKIPQKVYLHPIITHKLFLRILYEMLTADFVKIPPMPDGCELNERDYRNQFPMTGAGLLVQRALVERGNPLIAFFALSSSDNDDDIEKWGKLKEVLKCNTNVGWHQKVDDIRDYYGESIAFYFAFIVHYIKWLWPMAIIGTIFFCFQLGFNDISLNGSSFLVIFAIVWSVLMVENWYRRESKLRFKWGMMRFEQSEVPLPTFRGKIKLDETTGKFIETFSSITRYYLKITFSVSSMVFCIAVVCSVIFTSWYVKATFTRDDETSSLAIGVGNGVLIFIFNFIYTKLSLWLNEMEGHRLKKSYDNHLVFKRVLFTIINSFNSCFYIAFCGDTLCPDAYKNDDGTPNGDQRLAALRFQLLTLFATAIILQNSVEVLLPYVYTKLVKYCARKKEEKFKEEERQEMLSNDANADNSEINIEVNSNNNDDKNLPLYSERNVNSNLGNTRSLSEDLESKENSEINDTIKDIETQITLAPPFDVLANTSEIVVLHGYVMLFVIACPVMPLLCLANNYLEIRIDFWNLMKSQRPVPFPADGIGIWKLVMSSFNILAIFTNMLLVTFQTDLVLDILKLFVTFDSQDREDRGKLMFFFIFTMSVIAIILFCRWLIEDQTESTRQSMARQEACEKNILLSGKKIGNLSSKDYKKQQKLKAAVEMAQASASAQNIQ